MRKFKTTEKEEQIIKKVNVRGKIKNVINFDLDDKKYMIVVNKVVRLYAIRLINYEITNVIKIKAVKRLPDLIGFYKTKEEANTVAENIKENQEIINQCIYEIETQEDKVENILLIGRTGSGKSTLGNVLTNTDKFGVKASLASKTRNIQSEIFIRRETGIKYRVVDTIGVFDTKLTHEKVMFKFAEAIHSMKKGIKQVLVVIGGRLTEEEVEAFKLAEKIFGQEILKYTTLVRSNYKDFRYMEGKQDDDDKTFLEKSLSHSIEIIYVNNPSLDRDETRRKFDEEDRNSSRKILLNHLDKCQGSYKMDHWDNTCVRINDYMNAKRWKEEHEDTEGLRNKSELRRLTKEIVEEVTNQFRSQSEGEFRFRMNFHIPNVPVFGDIETVAKFKNCCSIT